MTTNTIRILGISGSLRPQAHNSALLRAAAWAVPPGVELVVFHDTRRRRAHTELRSVLGAIGARVTDHDLPLPALHKALDGESRLRDPNHHRGLTELLALLAAHAGKGPTGLAA